MGVMRAVGLFSGGLDSSLAICMVRDMGIDVSALHFYAGFRPGVNGAESKKEILGSGKELGLDVQILDISRELLNCVLHPHFGYGSGMNPCLDCRLLMLRKAGRFMKDTGAKFIVTGEVLNQRPMSQYRRALEMLEEESGLMGLILRPLSGKLLPETIPEKEGWVSREKLLAILGRSRKEQIALAREMEITKYSQPAGGCLLTDKNFSRKLKDLIHYRGEVDVEELDILKVGRHLRISPDIKMVVGRNHTENSFLEKYKSGRWHLKTVDYKGPLALLEGEPSEEELKLACAITAGYSDGAGESNLRVYCERDGEITEICVEPLGREVISGWLI